MGMTAVTGSASGIGAAIRRRLEADGDTVIGVDLASAEVVADLSTREGRKAAVAGVWERSGGRLDRLVACAGIGPHVPRPAAIASVNYFGAVEVLDALFASLRSGSHRAAVAMCSDSAQITQVDDHPYVVALLEHDEAKARRLVEESKDSVLAYAGAKNALGKAIRRRSLEWGSAGVRLNAVAPGPVNTPLLQAGLDDPLTGPAIRDFMPPLGRRGEPEEIAGLVAFLLGSEAAWIHGSVYFIDGGIDAQIRPDRY